MKNTNKSVLDGIPNQMPELQKAVELCKQAATIGFDWSSISPVFIKLEEEVLELKEAINGQNHNEIMDELGDVFFVIANLARHLAIDPQQALAHANKKFAQRFRMIEQLAKDRYPLQSSYNLETLDKIWNEIKTLESTINPEP